MISARKAAELATALNPREAPNPDDWTISISGGLAEWMLSNEVSLAFTSYQTGQLILAGVGPDGRLSFNEQNYARAMGLCYHDESLYVASMFQIWQLANMLKPGQFANNAFDLALVPRTAHTVNYIDTHEVAVDRDGRLIFVNSRYSCLATLDPQHSFRPIWKPSFISELAPEDRCHLNGLAMVDGAPAYVTAFSTTDKKEGWRTERSSGGVLIDVKTGRLITEKLSMPHSPRVHDGALWVLDSGRGYICRVDEQSGEKEEVAFCPGFLRGLSFINGYAVVTVSKARDGNFKELPLQRELDRRGVVERCGILIVDLTLGQVVENIVFEGKVTEMFDVALLPGVRNPMSVGPATVEMIGSVSAREEFAQLMPNQPT